MNTLEMLILWAEAEKEKATKDAKKESKSGNTMLSNLLAERAVAFSDMVVKAELLLNAERRKDGEKCDKK